MPSVVSVYYYIAFLVVTVVCFITMGLLFVLTAPFDPSRRVMHRFSRVWSWLIFAVHPGWRRRVAGREKIDRRKPYVIVTNHRSMLDIPNMYVLPLEFKWVSKREVYRMPVFGWVLRIHRDIGIDRMSASGTKKFLEQGRMWLAKGISIIIFPEGTRSRTDRMGRFKEGAFLLAKSAGVGILPVVADGTGRANDGWKMSRRNTFDIKVLNPIGAAIVGSTDTGEMARRVHDMMESEYEKMRADKQSKGEI